VCRSSLEIVLAGKMAGAIQPLHFYADVVVVYIQRNVDMFVMGVVGKGGRRFIYQVLRRSSGQGRGFLSSCLAR